MEKRERAEFIAIPVVIVAAGVLFILLDAAGVGLWAWLLAGAVGLAVVLTLTVRVLRRPDRPPPGEAPRRAVAASRDSDLRRVLLVLDDACAAPTLWRLAMADADAKRTEVLVIAPALGSRLACLTGDERAYAEATRRLDTTLRAFSDLGVDASGRLGSHDPIEAADDGLREFSADEVVFAVRAADRASWLERDVENVARRRYDVPVRSLVIDADGSRSV
jgi:hypothetical protein